MSTTKNEIRVARESDSQDILEHLRQNFFRDAPLASYLKIITDENPICEDLENSSMVSMENPYQNLVCFNSGKLIGVCLNEVFDKNYSDNNLTKNYKNTRYALIANFVSWFEKEANLFEKYPDIDKAFFVHNVSVDRSYRGQGIAQTLFEKTVELAKQLGYRLVVVNAASYYTARILEKIGFDVVHSYTYEDYMINGEVVFKPAAPHKTMTMYAKRV